MYRRAHFNAAHRLHVPQWTEAENKAFFGLCNNEHYHGHNYELVVQVIGYPDPITGFVINTKDLSIIVQEEVISKFDHNNLNLDTDSFKNLILS